MSKIEKFFFFAYVSSVILTVLFFTEIKLYLLALSFGLALPLFFGAPNLAIYGLPVVVAIAMAHTGVSRRTAGFFCLAGIGLIAVLPGYVNEKMARDHAARLASGDVVKSGYPSVRRLEIRQPFKLSGKNTPLRQAACRSICQKLLTGSEIDRVTVKAIGRQRGVLHSVSYAFEPRPSCPELEVDPGVYLAHTKRLNRRGQCIVTVPLGEAEPSELTVSLLTAHHRTSLIAGIKGKDVGPRLKVRRLEISDPAQEPAKRLRFRKTEMKTQVLSFPFRVTVELQPSYWGFAVARRPLLINPIDAEQVLRDETGFRLAVVHAEEGSKQQLEISTLLERPGNEPVSTVHDRLIIDYAKSLEAKAELSASEIETVRRVIADSRFRNISSVASMVRKFPKLTERFVP